MLQSRSSEKKLVKPLKNCFFGPNLYRKEVILGHAQDGIFFLAEITKADHKLLESFYFIKISYVLTELCYESFSILSDVFCQSVIIWQHIPNRENP